MRTARRINLVHLLLQSAITVRYVLGADILQDSGTTIASLEGASTNTRSNPNYVTKGIYWTRDCFDSLR